MAKARAPKGMNVNGLPQRMATFFESRPDEELTMEDAMVKFGVKQPQNVRSAVAALAKRGVPIVGRTVYVISLKEPPK